MLRAQTCLSFVITSDPQILKLVHLGIDDALAADCFQCKVVEYCEAVKVALEGNSVGISRTIVSLLYICHNV